MVARELYGPQYHELPHPASHLYHPGAHAELEHYRDDNRHVYDDKKDLERSLFGPHGAAAAHHLMQQYHDLDHGDYYYGADHHAPYYTDAHARALFGGHHTDGHYLGFGDELYGNGEHDFELHEPNGDIYSLA